MVYRKISSDLKECALRLWELGWSMEDVCQLFSVSPRSLQRWCALFEDIGQVVRPPSPLVGRTRLITRACMNAIETLLQAHPETYLDELVWWLAIHHDLAISKATLQKTLEEVGLTHKRLQKIAAERNEELRAEWREMVGTEFLGTGDEFVFVDETSKNDHAYARRYGYSRKGERAELIDVFTRGVRYSLVAALTKRGYIATRVMEGSFDAAEFYDFIVAEVVSKFLDCRACRTAK